MWDTDTSICAYIHYGQNGVMCDRYSCAVLFVLPHSHETRKLEEI